MNKILIITTNAGFISKFEMNDVQILLDRGFEVHYASNFDTPVYDIDISRLRAMGIRMHPLSIQKSPAALGRNIKAYRELKRIIRKEQITHIHCHNPMGGVLGRLSGHACKKEKPVVIYTAHGFHFYKGAPKLNWMFYYPVEKLLARYTDRLITINKEDYNRAGTFRLKKNGNVHQIPGVGVDIDKYARRNGAYEKQRELLGIPKEAFHIVSVAELNANKNQKVVLQALMKLNDKNIHYTICGKGVNPKISTENELIELINACPYPENIHMLGYRNDIEDILQGADAFAFPSYREGLGVAAIEAMACKLPVIAADNRGTREYMSDGENGYVLRASDVKGFAKAIRKLMNHEDRRKQFGERARSTSTRFSIRVVDQIMRDLYRSIE